MSAEPKPTTPETPEAREAVDSAGRPAPFKDTPLLAAKRRAFDSPTQANLDALIAAAQAVECETCNGTGLMEVLARVEPPDEREVYEQEACAECAGTGKGGVAKSLAAARAEEREKCAQRCDELAAHYERCGAEKRNAGRSDTYEAGEGHGAASCRDALRARGEAP